MLHQPWMAGSFGEELTLAAHKSRAACLKAANAESLMSKICMLAVVASSLDYRLWFGWLQVPRQRLSCHSLAARHKSRKETAWNVANF